MYFVIHPKAFTATQEASLRESNKYNFLETVRNVCLRPGYRNLKRGTAFNQSEEPKRGILLITRKRKEFGSVLK